MFHRDIIDNNFLQILKPQKRDLEIDGKHFQQKQQKKLAAKGIHVEIDSLRKDYDAQKAGGAANGTGIGGGNGKFDHHHFDARSVDAEIDVVGDDELGKNHRYKI